MSAPTGHSHSPRRAAASLGDRRELQRLYQAATRNAAHAQAGAGTGKQSVFRIEIGGFLVASLRRSGARRAQGGMALQRRAGAGREAQLDLDFLGTVGGGRFVPQNRLHHLDFGRAPGRRQRNRRMPLVTS